MDKTCSRGQNVLTGEIVHKYFTSNKYISIAASDYFSSSVAQHTPTRTAEEKSSFINSSSSSIDQLSPTKLIDIYLRTVESAEKKSKEPFLHASFYVVDLFFVHVNNNNNN